MINFYCIHCGTKIAAEDGWQGLESACPICQQKVHVPGTAMTKQLHPELPGTITARAYANHTQHEHPFRCSGCRLTIYSSMDEISNLVECPHCSATVMVSVNMNGAQVPVPMPGNRKVSHGAPTRIKNPIPIIVGVVVAFVLILFQLGGGSSLLFRDNRAALAPQDRSPREVSSQQGDSRER